MSIHMLFSPLDVLIDCLHDVRKASRVTKDDDVLSVQKRIAAVFLPIVKRIQAEARAEAMCPDCRNGDVAEFRVLRWRHKESNICPAAPIYQRLHREAQERKEGRS